MTKLEECFELRAKADILEEQVTDIIIKLLGLEEDYEDGKYYYDDICLDYYDYSVRISEVDPIVTPSLEQFNKLCELGFERLELRYSDGSELRISTFNKKYYRRLSCNDPWVEGDE